MKKYTPAIYNSSSLIVFDNFYNAYVRITDVSNVLRKMIDTDKVLQMPMCGCGCQGFAEVITLCYFNELMREIKEQYLFNAAPYQDIEF